MLLAGGCAALGPPGPGGGPDPSDSPGGKGDGTGAATRSSALGATPYPGGTTFRAWAPHATRVFVTGEFNGWSDTANELALEPGGRFAADVAGAHPGQQYRFVLVGPSGTVKKADPRARRLTNSVGPSIIVDPTAFAWTVPDFLPAPHAATVIYEMHVGSFNVTRQGRPGTFASATARLDDLAALGINMIELMPPAEFAQDFSWGYNPALPFAPESAYGTPDDLRTLVDEAHARGIGVLVDVVHNHWGSSDLGDSLWCFDATCLGAGGIYFYPDARRTTPWGPRPDYGRTEVRHYIRDNATMWLGEYHADGLRWDSTVNIRQASGVDLPDGWRTLQEANDATHALRPQTLQIAEDFRDDDRVTLPTAGGGAGFDAQWDADFFHPVDTAILAPSDGARSMAQVAGAITHQLSGRMTARVVYTESHDEVANGKQRIPQMISPADPGSWAARKRSTLGAAIALTAPGIPMIFMGQEFLEDGFFADTRPLDWSKATRYAGILALYRDLIALRRNLAGHTAGLTGESTSVFHTNENAKVLAFHRWRTGARPGDDVVVLANFSQHPFPVYWIGLPRGGTWHVRFNGDSTAYSSDFGGMSSADVTAFHSSRDGQPYMGSVALGAYSVVVLSQ